jgi:hypothetical protein
MAVWVSSNWTTHDQVGIRIINNTFKNWGGAAAQSEVSNNGSAALMISGGWAPPKRAYLPNGTVIRGNVFDGDRLVSIGLTSTRNSIVENNEIKNTTCARDTDGAVNEIGIKMITGTLPLSTGDIIRNNSIHDFAPSTACALTSAPGKWSAIIGIWADVGPNDGKVDGNRIWNLDQANGGVNSPAIGIHIEYDCHGWTVRNNIIYNIGFAGFRHNPTTTRGTANQWVNNTIYNVGVHGMETYSGNALIENDIVHNAGTSQIFVTENAVRQGNLTIDFNDYWDAAGGTRVGQWKSGTARKFSTWKTACNCDGHSLNADPLLVNPPKDFSLKILSPGRRAGAGGINMGASLLSPPSKSDY